MKVLMHICCGPCAVYPLRELREEGVDVEGYIFNPNIHPYTEFTRRLQTLETFAKVSLLPLHLNRSYHLEEFLKGALDAGNDRCLFCYRTRLDQAFKMGAAAGVDAVTTTLLYSKYQKHDAIKAIGEELAAHYSLPFLYRDFRKGWKEGIEKSIRLNMYRQNYCGCIFSEKERFEGK
jgi:epoxyqueuosine reductase